MAARKTVRPPSSSLPGLVWESTKMARLFPPVKLSTSRLSKFAPGARLRPAPYSYVRRSLHKSLILNTFRTRAATLVRRVQQLVGALLHYTTHHTESGLMSRPPRPKAGHNLFSVVREVRGSGGRTRERDATSERGRVQLRTEPRWGRWAASPSARASVRPRPDSFFHVSV